MMIPRKILLVVALLLGSVWAWAESSQGVTFLLKSGQKVSFAFTERPVIATSKEAVSVSTDGTERVSYAYADVARILFEESVVSAVESPVDDKAVHVVFLMDNGGLHARGLKTGELVGVYTLTGERVLSAKASSDGRVDLPCTTLSKGVYVISTHSGISYKWMNR